jgi:hypothetical protein
MTTYKLHGVLINGVLETFSKCNDYEHHNIFFFDIIEISKHMEPDKCTYLETIMKKII